MPFKFFQQNMRKIATPLISYSMGVGSMYLLSNRKEKNKVTSLLFEPKKLKTEYDYLAPDTSEIRRLQTKDHAERGDMAHCRLPPKCTSIAIQHKTVEEIWYFTNGTGEMWLKETNGHEHVIQIEGGMALTIPKGAAFQFRNTDEIEPLEVVITTMPPWPGPTEAIQVEGKWEPSIGNHSTSLKKL